MSWCSTNDQYKPTCSSLDLNLATKLRPGRRPHLHACAAGGLLADDGRRGHAGAVGTERHARRTVERQALLRTHKDENNPRRGEITGKEGSQNHEERGAGPRSPVQCKRTLLKTWIARMLVCL